MGVLLSKPNTEKEMETGGNEKLKFAVCSMQGWRTTMEDAHTAELDIDGKKSSFFGVFDGHAGTDVAIYASRHVHSNLRNSELFKSGKYEEALKEAFLKTDADLRTEEGHAECFKIRRELRKRDDDDDDDMDDRDSAGLTESGSTAVTCLMVGRELYCANAGDSRAVLCRDGLAVALSEDHKPMNDTEKTRIEKAGGFVEDKRVNGTLAVARAIGDFSFKTHDGPAEDQQVTCNPDIRKFELQEKDEFMILACDGIWDVVTSQQAVDLVRERIDKQDLGEILKDLFDQCLSPHPSANEGLGCDNMTAIIVKFEKK
mmetsp:Transcript_67365/g.179853  ORF Transcript_67365/g.179853 Transcript_67365/m.179853 type:complete len:315 (-) Transcript_67365:641-1585(-)|eukprot:CAMPEP_0113666454 /NCGR_PEP_ID=MMETSP0038_2-20120614/2882_1 /TAXON_ID=2898 /ORGANISM="Cryptomonas paramecium" /LENGTH=314 /DNA_ID=CAMNT_0000581945 /DNA_START=170 /DNA_END=1114 /DNA_ORIENTATION=+ /assembly_acc=CAM_ASM_000170